VNIKTGKSLVRIVAIALGIVCAQSGPAQTFKRMTVKGNMPMTQVSAGGSSVWALASNGHPYIYKGGQFVMAKNLVLTQIAAGGGSMSQPDAVWAINAATGNVYSATLTGTKWVFSQIPGALDFIAVGIGYNDNCHAYEVWGDNPAAQIFRYNYCLQNWQQIAGTLGTLAVGGGNIWGINGNGTPYKFNFATLSFEQALVHGTLSQISVGPNGAWATDGSRVYVYDSPLGEFFNLAPGVQVQAGGNGAWAIDGNHNTFYFDPYTLSFVRIPHIISRTAPRLETISVGGTGVWGINTDHQVCNFSTP
jgi:Tectonin domain